MAVNAEGEFILTEEPARVLGPDHPFLAAVAEDLKALCCHRDAGDLVISGWKPSGRPVSFAIESGSHGGPGREETRGFAVPPTGRFPAEKGFVRGLDLRAYVQGCVSRGKALSVPDRSEPEEDLGVRVLSYNIHSGINMNGRVFPERAARVIAESAPDIVALQEVDADMKRTFEVNQAALSQSRWVKEARTKPSILCGDLNAGPRSPAYRKLTAFLQDVQLLGVNAERLKPTFLSWYPVMRIDHILGSRHFRSLKVETPYSYDARMASDHLPVVADLCLKRETAVQ